ncbi:MAG: hypothetical protein WAZ14_03495 [Patescibacteria group bacterium]
MVNKLDIITALREQVQTFKAQAHAENVGTVLTVVAGVVTCSGLAGVKQFEVVDFGPGLTGLVVGLAEEYVTVVVLGTADGIKAGDTVRQSGAGLSLPVSESLWGRVVNVLGQPVDGLGEILAAQTEPITLKPDSSLSCQRLQVEKSYAAAEVLRVVQEGKTQGLKSVVVTIGERTASLAQLKGALEAAGCLQETLLVVAGAAEPVALRYLAPFSAEAVTRYLLRLDDKLQLVFVDLAAHTLVSQSWQQLLGAGAVEPVTSAQLFLD